MTRCLAPDCQMGGLGCDNMTVVLVGFLHGKPYEDLVARCSVQPLSRTRLHSTGSTNSTPSSCSSTSPDTPEEEENSVLSDVKVDQKDEESHKEPIPFAHLNSSNDDVLAVA